MSKESGYQTAIQTAIEKLRNIDLAKRCPTLGLPLPGKDFLNFRGFGLNLSLRLSDFDLFEANSFKPVKVSDRILVLHYLQCGYSLENMGKYPGPTEKLISFRQIDSGMFYWEAFLSRSIRPLVSRINNKIELLKTNLNRFEWQQVALGDFAARIHAIGKIFITLIYHLGDEEFPASADLLFDEGIKHVYVTEDIAVLASRICLGLL